MRCTQLNNGQGQGFWGSRLPAVPLGEVATHLAPPWHHASGCASLQAHESARPAGPAQAPRLGRGERP